MNVLSLTTTDFHLSTYFKQQTVVKYVIAKDKLVRNEHRIISNYVFFDAGSSEVANWTLHLV